MSQKPSPVTALLLATLTFVAIGPAVLAYRCWGLGELPQAYHALAFALIVAGIWVSSQR